MQGQGTYSFYYSHEGGDTSALDWNFFGNGWSASVRDGVRWHPYKESDEKMHQALLEHFGLTAWKDEYPFQKIRDMHPNKLALERRQKEAEDSSLPRHEMKSDTAGYHVDAEEHHSF